MRPPPVNIENCQLIYQCPKTWDRLTETDDLHVRFCDQCHKPVHWVTTEEELATHAAQRHCVAIAPESSAGLLGLIIPQNWQAENTKPDEPNPPEKK